MSVCVCVCARARERWGERRGQLGARSNEAAAGTHLLLGRQHDGLVLGAQLAEGADEPRASRIRRLSCGRHERHVLRHRAAGARRCGSLKDARDLLTGCGWACPAGGRAGGAGWAATQSSQWGDIAESERSDDGPRSQFALPEVRLRGLFSTWFDGQGHESFVSEYSLPGRV